MGTEVGRFLSGQEAVSHASRPRGSRESKRGGCCALPSAPPGGPTNGILTPNSASLSKFARVAELADALASGASVRKDVGVQVPPRAQRVFHEIQKWFS